LQIRQVNGNDADEIDIVVDEQLLEICHEAKLHGQLARQLRVRKNRRARRAGRRKGARTSGALHITIRDEHLTQRTTHQTAAKGFFRIERRHRIRVR
jgi:hypothetical protein